MFRARDHLKKHGAKITYEGRRRAGCQVSVEFLDPDGHHLELYWGVDQIGSDGRSRPWDEWRQTATLEDAVRHAPPGQDTTLHDAALLARVEGNGPAHQLRRPLAGPRLVAACRRLGRLGFAACHRP